MRNCLFSLENQICKPKEIIIVDDCSTDDTYSQLIKYSENSSLNIIILKNEKNLGPSLTRQKAIDASNGEYIAFCDCDDWFEFDYLQNTSKLIYEKNPDIVMCDYYTAYDNRKIKANITTSLINADKKAILACGNMSLCILTVRKTLFEDIIFPPLYNGEDAAIVPQLIAKTENLEVIDKPLYNYYFRLNSLSKSPSKTAYLDMIKAFNLVNSTIKENYTKECESIGISYICYGATLNAFKVKLAKKEIAKVIDNFEKEYPLWYYNKYIKNFGKIKTLYLYFIKRRFLFFAKIMASFHRKYVMLKRI